MYSKPWEIETPRTAASQRNSSQRISCEKIYHKKYVTFFSLKHGRNGASRGDCSRLLLLEVIAALARMCRRQFPRKTGNKTPRQRLVSQVGGIEEEKNAGKDRVYNSHCSYICRWRSLAPFLLTTLQNLFYHVFVCVGTRREQWFGSAPVWREHLPSFHHGGGF